MTLRITSKFYLKKYLIGAVFNGKDSKRGVDYRTSLIKVCCHFKKEYPDSKFTFLQKEFA